MSTCVVSTVVFLPNGDDPVVGAILTAVAALPQALPGGMFGNHRARDISEEDGLVTVELYRGATYYVHCEALGVRHDPITVPDSPTADLAALLAEYETPAVGPTVAIARAETFDTAVGLLATSRPDGSFAYAVDTFVHYFRQDGEWVTISGADLTAEAATRAAADIVLQGNITAEGVSRNAVDDTLQDYIEAEAFTRSAADAAESAARIAADGALDARIDFLELQLSIKKDFGAVGDGTTDDTAALNALGDYIRALPPGSGCAVYFPSGTYMASNVNWTKFNYLFDKTIVFYGDGTKTSVIKGLTAATGNLIDMCACNYVTVREIGIWVGPNGHIGLLLARYEDAPNANRNIFDRVWFLGSATKTGMAAIAAESTIYQDCIWDCNAPASFYIGAANNIGAVSAFGTIPAYISNIDNHFFGCRWVATPGNVCIHMSDGNGLEMVGCATYNGTNVTALLAHIKVDNPTNLDGAVWPTRIDHHLFEGKGDRIKFFAADHGNGATYKHFTITKSWASVGDYEWVSLDMTGQGESPLGIIHSHFTFKDNASPLLGYGTTGGVTLNEVEHSEVDHAEDGATITILGTNNVCRIRGRGAGVSLANSVCSRVTLMTPYVDLGKNHEVFGGADGQGGVYICYTPASSAPHASQLFVGMLAYPNGVSWDPCGLASGGPYFAQYDGSTWRSMAADFLPSRFRVALTGAPAAADSTGTQGQVAFDSGFLYLCTATDTWVRAALSTWP